MDNLSTKQGCQKCRECCKFEKDEIYFAPLFTKEEVDELNKENITFKKKSNNVFQIELKKSNNYYVCPFLDESNHLCTIYEKRPFDCRIWPFIFMKKDNRIVLACFDKDLCPDMENMKKRQFPRLTKKVLKWIKKNDILKLIKEHEGLVWGFEEDAFVVKDITQYVG